MKHVGIVAVSILVCALIIAGAFCFIRRKKFQIKRECPNISLLTEFSSVGTQRTSHNNENNQRIDKIYVGNSPTECLYDLADNSKLEDQTQYNQENEALYHYLRENVPTNNVNNDTYMLAGYKTSDEDTVYFGGMEDPYDHLRGTDRTRHEDDTYDHAPNLGEPSYSSLNINVGRNTSQSHVEESIYDHFEG